MVYSHDRRIRKHAARSVAAGATGSATPSSPRSASCSQERSFADLSVSTISERAGVARSGFYFYFDSKYAVLAVILADAMEELDKLTHDFAPREPDETPAAVRQADGRQRGGDVRHQRPGDAGLHAWRRTPTRRSAR